MNFFLKKMNTYTANIEKAILSLSIILMMVNTTANALGRYILSQSIYFSEELNQFLIVSVTFLGLAYAVRHGRNIRMTAIYDYLPHRNKKKLVIIIAITSSILMFILSYESFLYVMQLKKINRQSPALQIQVYLVYMIVPIGFLMTGIQFFVRFLKNLLHKEEIYLSYDVVEKKKMKNNKDYFKND